MVPGITLLPCAAMHFDRKQKGITILIMCFELCVLAHVMLLMTISRMKQPKREFDV